MYERWNILDNNHATLPLYMKYKYLKDIIFSIEGINLIWNHYDYYLPTYKTHRNLSCQITKSIKEFSCKYFEDVSWGYRYFIICDRVLDLLGDNPSVLLLPKSINSFIYINYNYNESTAKILLDVIYLTSQDDCDTLFKLREKY